ncbi:MAG: NAD(P)/FAD-dependent oxidoreductase [Hyphomonadaceae bacterium]|nr:NAD(P)/FAD-dependent oxidoreductase [Hyphomonadaceae bacterium]
MADCDVLVVGAGAVGLACGYAAAQAGAAVIVIDKEGSIGAGVSSRNSEVIHAGLHYPPGSLKARLCVRGRRLLYAFLDRFHVAYAKCEKLIVATEASEGPAIAALHARGLENEVEGLRMISRTEALAMEPALACVAALHSAESGVFDSHGYLTALVGAIEAHGGAVVLHTPMLAAERSGDGFAVHIGGESPAVVTARAVIIAAGLQAQNCAAAVAEYPAHAIPRLHFGKGNYFTLSGPAPFRRLIYPPPIPGALGMHYRLDLGGQARFGPDLEFVDRENYAVSVERAPAFYAYVRRFWPSLPDGALAPDYAGIRPKLHGPCEAQTDFRIDDARAHGLPGLVALFGIESPGLTASLAIGEEVVGRLQEILQ